GSKSSQRITSVPPGSYILIAFDIMYPSLFIDFCAFLKILRGIQVSVCVDLFQPKIASIQAKT
ncbi:MAG: hypothetical protein KAS40_13560, partial [Desulfobacterales bacterium]|nr:hypothetical protein [Desulfobacterales bacterium]